MKYCCELFKLLVKLSSDLPPALIFKNIKRKIWIKLFDKCYKYLCFYDQFWQEIYKIQSNATKVCVFTICFCKWFTRYSQMPPSSLFL